MCFICTPIIAFNVEDRIPLVKVGPKDSLFGLAVAEHHMISQTNNINDIVFLVGAPKAVVDGRGFLNDSGPGALYKCDVLSNSHECEQVRINYETSTRERDSSQQWLGITVQSQKPGGKVAVCGHRYTRRGLHPSRGVIWEELVGRCYESDNRIRFGNTPEIYDPCYGMDPDSSHSHNYFAYCQAGTSLAFARNSEEDLVIGTPGVFHWTGGIASRQLNPEDEFQADTLWSQLEGGGPVHLNSYLGFSTAFANISNLNSVSMVAGAPRANDTGSVVIYQKNGIEGLVISEILRGERIASSYGYDLKVLDITGDGRDDLIVGAPQYYDREKKFGGAIYIYVNKGLSQLGPDYTSVRYGELDSSFGNSITSLGDINMDGVNDVAIGAPGDDNGVGRVYIFHGNPNHGIDEHPSQILKGADLDKVNDKNVTGFGYSVSGSLDMDLNGYPDLTVGSLSDIAVLYRTRPIVNVQAAVTPLVSNSKIDINITTAPEEYVVTFYDSVANKTYKLVTFNVTVCLNYTSFPETFDAPVDLMYTLILDAEKAEQGLRSRVTFIPGNYSENSKTANVTLPKQSSREERCETLAAYLDNDMQDKLSPFVFSLKYELITLVPPKRTRGKLVSLNKFPILNKDVPDTVTSQVNISKNCGKDEICHSNLTVKSEYVVLLHGSETWGPLQHNDNNIPVLMVGTEKGFGIRAAISNSKPGEDAHQAQLKLILPEFLRLSGTEPKTVKCTENAENATLVECGLGNPFRTNNELTFIVKLENSDLLYNMDSFNISIAIATSSVQEGLSFQTYPILVRKQVALKIDGYTNNDQIPFGGEIIGESAAKLPASVGLPVIHTYEIKNIGTTEVNDVIATIDWPYAILNEKWLFYLLSVETLSASSTNQTICSVPLAITDPLNLLKNEKAREKREAKVDEETPVVKKSVSGDSIVSSPTLKCPETARCVRINCTIGSIASAQRVFINIKGVTWNSTFLEEFNSTTQVIVFSNASVLVDISNVQYASSSVLHYKVQTTMNSEIITKPQQDIELWIIVVACLGGVVLLVIIVLLLWKCGFFKRKKDFGDYHKARKHRQASKKADEVSDRLVY